MHAAGLATMAYYYFDFRGIRTQDYHGLLSLVLQLFAKSDSCYNVHPSYIQTAVAARRILMST